MALKKEKARGKQPAAKAESGSKSSATTLTLSFDNNALLPSLYGDEDEHLMRLERQYGIQTASRGNILVLTGAQASVEAAKRVLESLYGKLKAGQDITTSQVEAALRMVGDTAVEESTSQTFDRKNEKAAAIATNVHIKTMKKTVVPYSHTQSAYFKALATHDLVFALGPAGTGKTYIAVAMAVNAFINKKVDRIILSRPAVEAGEKLGFLPGDLKDKIDPYLRPLYDALNDMMPAEKVQQHIETGEFEVAPLAFMRGRTLGNAFVILDEAQNTTPTQMKMFLTRMGENSRMVVTGDLSQCDLPRDVASGLRDAVNRVGEVEGISTIQFGEKDVVRHALAARIVKAYDEYDRRSGTSNPNAPRASDK